MQFEFDTSPSAFARAARVSTLFCPPRSESVGCLVCQDDFESQVCFHAPCGHFYCPDCTVYIAQVAITEGNEGLLPVRCCGKPLPLEKFLEALPAPLRDPVAAKSEEMAIPPPQRLYCPNGACSAFIGKSSGERGVVSCPQCCTKICSACKERDHSPEPCGRPDLDKLTHEATEFASRQGWKICPGCSVFVEHRDGCRHMRCRCGTEFCYQCGGEMHYEGSWYRCARG